MRPKKHRMRIYLFIFLLLVTSCDVLSLWQDPDTRVEVGQLSPEEKLYRQALSETPDIAEVDRMVADYRRRLIVERYIDRMIETHQVAIEEEDCERYYEQVHRDLKLKHTIVQGMLVQLPCKTPKSSSIRTAMKKVLAGDYEKIEELETYCIDHSMVYDQFVDSWREMPQVLSLIPIDVVEPKDLKRGDYTFTDKDKQYEYHLLLTDYKKAGSEAPYAYAKPEILDYLAQKARTDYRKRLIEMINDN